MIDDALHNRLRRHKQRLEVRAWRFRQRLQAQGVWEEVRRALAAARCMHVIDADGAQLLLTQGFSPLAVGRRLQPVKQMFILSSHQVAQLSNATSIPVRLSAQFLAAACLVLEPFDDDYVSGFSNIR